MEKRTKRLKGLRPGCAFPADSLKGCPTVGHVRKSAYVGSGSGDVSGSGPGMSQMICGGALRFLVIMEKARGGWLVMYARTPLRGPEVRYSTTRASRVRS